MSRSTGTFPRYTKLDIDSEKWPNDYFNSSRFCESCETHWPASHLFSTCPIDGEETKIDEHNKPDLRWPDALKTLLNARFDILYEEYNEGLTDEQLAWEAVKKTDQYDFEKLDSEVTEELDDALKSPSTSSK